MKKSLGILVFMATTSSSGFAYTIQDALRNLPSEECIDLSVEITSLKDGATYPTTLIPICTDISHLYDATDLSECIEPSAGVVGQPIPCIIKASAKSAVAQVRAGGLNDGVKFLARVEPKQRNNGGCGYGTSCSYGIFPFIHFSIGPQMIRSEAFEIISNWDYRINQIMAALKSKLPVLFSTIMMPAVGSSVEVTANTVWDQNGNTSRLAYLSTTYYGASSPNTFTRATAIGYDLDKNEYQVDLKFPSATYQGPFYGKKEKSK